MSLIIKLHQILFLIKKNKTDSIAAQEWILGVLNTQSIRCDSDNPWAWTKGYLGIRNDFLGKRPRCAPGHTPCGGICLSPGKKCTLGAKLGGLVKKHGKKAAVVGLAGTATGAIVINHKKTQANDPHTILGVRKNASPGEIKAAYRTAALRNHPDLVQGYQAKLEAEERMKKINAAYSNVKNKNRKDSILNESYQAIQTMHPNISQEWWYQF
jgi:hypothetical protein